MNSGQSLLSIGALLLLSLTVLRVNNSILSTDTVLQDSKLGILGVSLATSLIEEASKKAFDLASAEDAVTDLDQLTSPWGLGPGAGETSPETFNDFDDFNGYTEVISSLPSAPFTISCEVCYVSDNNIDGKIMEKTWHKKIIVKVTSPSMRDTVKLSNVYSYWHFR